MLEQIEQAYKTVDLNPCQDEYYIAGPDGGLCCPLTALALAEGAVAVTAPNLGYLVYTWAVGKYGEMWVRGFQDGWDWRWPGPKASKTDPAYRAGFELGKAIFKALIAT